MVVAAAEAKKAAAAAAAEATSVERAKKVEKVEKVEKLALSRGTVTFPPAISQKKIHGSICPLKRVRDRKEWRFRDRRCRSLGGLRRRHAPPPEAGALHGARHGASGAVPPVGRTASFIMTLPPWVEDKT